MKSFHPFPYDEFQKKAIAAIDGNASIFVSAPTGSGKTVIAEHVIADAITLHQRVVYTAPIKALSNQKYREFVRQYGEANVGILTGDVNINRDAQIIVMTTEIYRNTLLDEGSTISDVAWIIFDEVHYLDDAERGTVWEEAIIFTPKQTRILALSATVPNARELCDWMEQILNRSMVLVEETKRPVPLTFAFQAQNRFYTDFSNFKEDAYRDLKKPKRYFRGRRPKDPITPNSLPRLIERIKSEDGFPCLYFAFGRKLTEELAYNSLPNLQLKKTEKEEIEKRFNELCEKYAVQNEPTIKKLTPLIRNGLAYHHAGMLPTTKEIIEQLFNEKRLKMIFATETFALGLNMPVRTVIFDSIRKYYPGGFDVLKTRDFFQMAGRAGRRGMDDFGRVYLRINPKQVRAEQVKNCVYGEAQPVLSQFNASYATLLNLYDKHGEDVISIYPDTLNYFQSSKRQRRLERQKFLDRLQVLKKTGCIRNDALTNKGRFACWFFGYELIMSELFMEGLLDRWDPAELGLALATLVYEAKPGSPPIRHLPNRLAKVLREVTKAYYQIEIVEGSYRIENPVRAPEPNLMKATELWLKNANFQDTVQASKIDEGELIRYFRMIIQLARQLAIAPGVSDKIKSTAEDLKRLMDRGVVDAERQLRS